MDAQGIHPLPDRVRDLMEFRPPVTRVGVQRFLGMINYYRRFVPHMAESLAPLHALTAGKKSTPFEWTATCQEAFDSAKKKLAAAVLLHHPNPFSATALTVDASDTAVGAELSQRATGEDSWQPIAFYSHTLTAQEKKYSAFDRELLAAYLSVKHFKYYLEGKKFIIFTDHKPLTHAIVSNTDNRSPRQTRHLSYVAEFTTDLRHIGGSHNVVADALSRPPPPPPSAGVTSVEVAPPPSSAPFPGPGVSSVAFPGVPAIDFAAMQAAQDPSALLDNYSLSMKQVAVQGTTLWCDTSHNLIRPLVPLTFRKSVFASLHGLSHPGSRPTIKLITKRFLWPGMKKDIREWCRTCLPCQTAKVGRHTKSPIQTIPPAKRRFGSIHVDLVGPLPDSEGCRYLLTIVDRFTRWPEVFPVADMTSTTCAKTFIRQWLPRYGVPDVVVTDRGTQFVGGVWKELMQSLGVQSHSTTAYHPQSNGLVERMHRQLKASVRARLVDSNWQDSLPLVLLGLRSAWRDGPDVAPAQMLYGTTLRLPGEFVTPPEFISPSPSPFLSEFQMRMRSNRAAPSLHHTSSASSSSYVPRDLLTASMVLIRHDGVRKPLQNPYDGPYPVLEAGDKVFKVLRNGLPYTVSVDRLKPCHLPPGPRGPMSSIIPNRVPPPPHPALDRVIRPPTSRPPSSAAPPSVSACLLYTSPSPRD